MGFLSWFFSSPLKYLILLAQDFSHACYRTETGALCDVFLHPGPPGCWRAGSMAGVLRTRPKCSPRVIQWLPMLKSMFALCAHPVHENNLCKNSAFKNTWKYSLECWFILYIKMIFELLFRGEMKPPTEKKKSLVYTFWNINLQLHGLNNEFWRSYLSWWKQQTISHMTCSTIYLALNLSNVPLRERKNERIFSEPLSQHCMNFALYWFVIHSGGYSQRLISV